MDQKQLEHFAGTLIGISAYASFFMGRADLGAYSLAMACLLLIKALEQRIGHLTKLTEESQ